MTLNQVREFEIDPEGQTSKQEEMAKLQKDQDELRQSLQQWCYQVYGEVIFLTISSSGVLVF